MTESKPNLIDGWNFENLIDGTKMKKDRWRKYRRIAIAKIRKG